MSRESTLILLGILVAVSPFLGIPHSWLYVLMPVAGILVAIIGYTLRGSRVSVKEG